MIIPGFIRPGAWTAPPGYSLRRLTNDSRLCDDDQDADPAVIAGTVDGAHAPIRPQGGRSEKRGPGYWREAKGFRIFLTDSRGRITPLASWHQIENAEEFSRDLALVARRIPQERVRIALVGDGPAGCGTPWLKTSQRAAGARLLSLRRACLEGGPRSV